jgi:hypothetical protein
MRQKDCILLGREICRETFLIRFLADGRLVQLRAGDKWRLFASTDVEALADRDGFEDVKSFLEWFRNQYETSLHHRIFQVVRW